MEDVIVSVENGRIAGQKEKDYKGGKFYSFCGIPYAKAPVGHLRFKAPVPLEPWTGIWNGKKEGPACPAKMQTCLTIGKEDNCLHMNIFTKELPKHQPVKNPVMVFLYGGGFMLGSNHRIIYGPEYLLTENIVLVVVNYRIGVLGFLSLEDPSLDVPGNAGLKDQVSALKWVQKNIHNFGGDPDNVTVFGESAGSSSIHYLLLSPKTKGLFHKAIMQSGSAFNPWARGRRNALDIAKAMGYKDTDEKIILQKLQNASIRSLMDAQYMTDCCLPKTFDAAQVRPFGPVIEYSHPGALLSEDPEEIMKSGRCHQIPIIMGFNSLEGLFYGFTRSLTSVPPLSQSLERDIPYDWNISQKPGLIQDAVKKIKEFYFGDTDISEENIAFKYKLFGDIGFLHGIQKTARLFKLHGTAPIYMYRFSLEGPLNTFKKLCVTNHPYILLTTLVLGIIPGCSRFFTFLSKKLSDSDIVGAAHADEISHLFKPLVNLPIVEGSEEDSYVKKLVKLWTNFAKFGNPTPKKDVTLDNVIWEPVKSDRLDNICDINKTVTITENFESLRVAFWDNMYRNFSA
nr:esterase E4-like [Leptinotarsa decemlineata]